jgi:hypothetical protein
MFNKIVVNEAIKRSLTGEYGRRLLREINKVQEDSLISLLIHDTFGGEILKTHTKNNWHFYNRIDGERIDLAGSEIQIPASAGVFEDIPSTPDETYGYIDQVDYSNFFFRFIRAFEEAVGLENQKYGLTG